MLRALLGAAEEGCQQSKWGDELSYKITKEIAFTDKVSGIPKFVLMMLAQYCNNNGDSCYPKTSTMAQLMGLDEKTIRRNIIKLEKLGLVEVNRKSGIGNEYRILTKELSAGSGQKVLTSRGRKSQPKKEGRGRKSAGSGRKVRRVGAESPTPTCYSNKPINKPINKSISNSELEKLFDEFYSAYRRKVGRKGALQKYKVALKQVTHETIMAGLERYNQHIDATNKEMRFIKHPSTWLNQGCWDDEYDDDSLARQAERTLTAIKREREESRT